MKLSFHNLSSIILQVLPGVWTTTLAGAGGLTEATGDKLLGTATEVALAREPRLAAFTTDCIFLKL